MLRGFQPVISSSQASSGASVCVVRSRNALCGKRLTRSWKLMASVSVMLHNLFSDSERERRCCTAQRTREVPSVSRQHLSYERLQRSFLVFESTHVPAQEKHHLSFSNPCVCQISNTSTIHLLPNVSKAGLDESLCDVFEVTAPPRCTPCTTLLSHEDAVSQLRPPLRHCTELDQDLRKLSCRSVSFPTTTATERNLSFDVSHCEL